MNESNGKSDNVVDSKCSLLTYTYKSSKTQHEAKKNLRIAKKNYKPWLSKLQKITNYISKGSRQPPKGVFFLRLSRLAALDNVKNIKKLP
jgi:hypothetical protein